jgi:hypothetical protein
VNNLVFSYPVGFLLICALVGALYAGVLYFRESRFAENRALAAVLAVLRFAVVTVIGVLLLEPMVRYFEREVEPPIVVIAIDNSQSMVLGGDSTKLRTALPQMIDQLQASLNDKYDLVGYTFGEKLNEGLSTDFSAPVTDLSAVFAEIQNRYGNRNLGAVIVATDGIYNRGANPRYALGASPWKVLPLAMGDTTLKRDALIAEVAANRIAYLGNKFPVEVVLEARKLDGASVNFSIVQRDKTLHNETIEVKGPAFRHTLRVLLNAEQAGTQRYTLKVAPMDGELTLANNVRELYVDVIDGRQKVLLLAGAPHPDVAALRSAIVANENYQVDVQLFGSFKADLSAYDLIVLHQVPVVDAGAEAFRLSLLRSDKPIFAIVGTQSVISMLPKYGLGVDISGWRGSYHDVGAAVADGFSTFKVSEDLQSFLRDAPPLKVPFGELRKANSADVLLYQRVGSILTEDPLLVVNRGNDRKVAVLFGEGLWRWRLYDYATAQSHERFDGFISSLVQYLALKADKRFFRLNHEPSFMENQRIIFTSELYNDAYEPVNESEVSIVFSNEEGREYPFVFSRTASAYRLDAGALPVGNYNFVAGTVRDGQKFEERGRITVKPYALEGADLTANHALLQALASASGGKVFYPNQIDEIEAYLDQTADLKPVSYTSEVFDNILNLKWIFFLILLLLSSEWFLRKRSGNY